MRIGIHLLLPLLSMALSCVAWSPPQVDPGAKAVAYFPATSASIKESIQSYASFDGKKLGYQTFAPVERRAATAFVYLHGIESHGGWFVGAARRLALAGYDVHCLDRRGSGINRELRGFPSGDIDRYQTWIEDVNAFVQSIRDRYSSIHLIGLSWGGKQATGVVLAHPQLFDSLVLITPGIRSIVDVPWTTKIGVMACSWCLPTKSIEIPIRPEMFSSDPDVVSKIREDPLRLQNVTARFLIESRRLDRFIDRRIQDNRTPVLLLLAGHDPIVDNEGTQSVLKRGAQQPFVIDVFEDQIHSIQFDAVDRLTDRIIQWATRIDPACKFKIGGRGHDHCIADH